MPQRLNRSASCLTAFLLALLLVGCDRAKPPEPAAAADIPRVLREAFRVATPETKALAEGIIEAVEARQWTGASAAIQVLSASTKLTAVQRNELARCLITVNAQVAEAAAAGDEQAGQLRQLQRTDK